MHIYENGCGGPTRTGDLQVMSLASYQLLHPAMCVLNEIHKQKSLCFSFASTKVVLFFYLAKVLLYFY